MVLELVNPYHNRMLFTSNLFILLGLIAALNNLPEFFILNTCLFLTSVNYWKYPLKNWRRKLDLCMVSIFAIVHIWYLHLDDFYFLMLTPFVLYLCAKMSTSRNISSILHTLIHISVFFICMIFYENLELRCD